MILNITQQCALRKKKGKEKKKTHTHNQTNISHGSTLIYSEKFLWYRSFWMNIKQNETKSNVRNSITSIMISSNRMNKIRVINSVYKCIKIVAIIISRKNKVLWQMEISLMIKYYTRYYCQLKKNIFVSWMPDQNWGLIFFFISESWNVKNSIVLLCNGFKYNCLMMICRDHHSIDERSILNKCT